MSIGTQARVQAGANRGLSVVDVIVVCVQTTNRQQARGQALEPHVPVGRLEDGTWVYGPYGAMLAVASGRQVVCHACGEPLAAISRPHARRHGLDDLAAYRERFGLNRKQSLTAPALTQARRVEGRRRWESNTKVRDGLALGQQMARSGVLYELGAAAQPAGSRRSQGRVPASREGASPALRNARQAQTSAARGRWEARARALGFEGVDAYLAVRRADGSSAHRVRTELGCGGSVAARLLQGASAPTVRSQVVRDRVGSPARTPIGD